MFVQVLSVAIHFICLCLKTCEVRILKCPFVELVWPEWVVNIRGKVRDFFWYWYLVLLCCIVDLKKKKKNWSEEVLGPTLAIYSGFKLFTASLWKHTIPTYYLVVEIILIFFNRYLLVLYPFMIKRDWTQFMISWSGRFD